MKKTLLIIILIFFVLSLIANELRYTSRKVINQNVFIPGLVENSRDIEFEIIIEPISPFPLSPLIIIFHFFSLFFCLKFKKVKKNNNGL